MHDDRRGAPSVRGGPALRSYRRREPEHSALYAVLQSYLETCLAQACSEGDARAWHHPERFERALRALIRRRAPEIAH